jgi:hypothetical protein
MRTNVITLTGVENLEQVIGNNNTVHTVFTAETSDKEEILITLTDYYMRHKAGINKDLLDNIYGCTVTLIDNVDLAGNITTPQERIESVLEGTYSRLLTNNSNVSNFVKSESYRAAAMEFNTTVKAKAVIEQDKERQQIALNKRIEALKARKVAQARTGFVPNEKQQDENTEPQFETNDAVGESSKKK